MERTIYLGADYAGFDLKERVKAKLLENAEYRVEDLTPGPIDPNDDYPLVAEKVTEKVIAKGVKGILVCGSGNGMCMAANKHKGARAALGYNTNAAKWAREHLDANILCLAGRVLNPEYANVIVRDWLVGPGLAEERHERRIKQVVDLEK